MQEAIVKDDKTHGRVTILIRRCMRYVKLMVAAALGFFIGYDVIGLIMEKLFQ